VLTFFEDDLISQEIESCFKDGLYNDQFNIKSKLFESKFQFQENISNADDFEKQKLIENMKIEKNIKSY